MMSKSKRHIVFARLGSADAKLVRDVTKARGEAVSTFIRRAIRKELGSLSYLNDQDMKALGLSRGQLDQRSGNTNHSDGQGTVSQQVGDIENGSN